MVVWLFLAVWINDYLEKGTIGENTTLASAFIAMLLTLIISGLFHGLLN